MSDPLVRPARPDDAEAIAAVYAPWVTGSVVSFEEAAPDAAEMRRRMLAEPRMPWLVGTRDDAVIGYAYAAAHRARRAYRWSVDTSIYLVESERGRGTGRRLYDRLVAELGGLGYVSAFAGIALPNPASVRLHEAMGFTPVGVYRNVGFKQGSWRDVGWWQLALGTPVSPPPEPRPWSG